MYNCTGAVSECTHISDDYVYHIQTMWRYFLNKFERCHQIYTSCTYLVLYSNPYLREYIYVSVICYTCVKMSCKIEM